MISFGNSKEQQQIVINIKACININYVQTGCIGISQKVFQYNLEDSTLSVLFMVFAFFFSLDLKLKSIAL